MRAQTFAEYKKKKKGSYQHTIYSITATHIYNMCIEMISVYAIFHQLESRIALTLLALTLYISCPFTISNALFSSLFIFFSLYFFHSFISACIRMLRFSAEKSHLNQMQFFFCWNCFLFPLPFFFHYASTNALFIFDCRCASQFQFSFGYVTHCYMDSKWAKGVNLTNNANNECLSFKVSAFNQPKNKNQSATLKSSSRIVAFVFTSS